MKKKYSFTYLNKFYSLSIFLFLISLQGFGQTILLSPTVNNGGFEHTTALNGWSTAQVNTGRGGWANGIATFYAGTKSAYISRDNGTTNNYLGDQTRVQHLYRAITFPAGEANISLSFYWKGIGEGASNDWDNLQVFVSDTAPTAGSVKPTADRVGDDWYNGQTTWQNVSLTLPAAYAGTTKYLIFQWKQDASTTNNPPAAIDNITLVSSLPPPPPANDICAGAISLTPSTNTTCIPTTGSTTGATDNNETGDCTIGTENAVWYSFVATSTSHIVTVDGITGFNAVLGAISSCGTTIIPSGGNCVNATGNNGIETLTLTNLTISNTYYVQVYDSNGDQTANGFTICVTTPPPPPANDLCTNATPLPCGTTNLAGTTNNTTNVAHNTGCYMSNYGVWYTFTGDGNQTTITATGSGGFDLEMATTSGSCGALTNIDCDDVYSGSETYTFITTNGANYYVYVAGWSDGSTTTGNFTISRTCATVTPPPNDNCINATSLTVNPDQNCGVVTSGTVEFASNSGVNVCGGTEDDDVWYSFVATNTSHRVSLINIAGSTTDMYHAVYNAAPGCGGLTTAIICNDGDISNLTGLTIGNTYYVQVYTYTATTGQTSTFNICVGTPPPPPTNDECNNAISLTVNPDFNCGVTTAGTIQSATNSGITSNCGGTDDDDVWFTFVATNTSHSVDLLNVTGSTTDLYHAIYAVNPCTGPDTAITCSDPNNSLTSGLTIGATYYVQVFSYTSTGGQTSNFDICIGTPPPPPTNDEPCSAIALTVNSTCIGTSGSVYLASNSGIDACYGTPDNDVWYSFVATNTTQTVSLFNISGSDTDMYHAVYGPFTPPDCSVAVGDNISCNDGDSTDLTGLTVGATYFVQVFTYFSGPETTSFEICVTEPCTNSVPISTYPTLCPTTIIDEQGNNPFDADPFILDPTVNLDCSLPTVTLEVNSNLKETTSYIVEQITYPNPAPNYDFPLLGNGDNQSITTDDYWADSKTNLGFDFCFYENSHTQTLVSPNGAITFNSNIDAADYAGYSFNNNLPSTVGALFEQTIYGVYHDIIPTSLPVGAIKSRTIGNAPCRQFQVSWHDIPMFSDNTRFYTGMIVLHETTNIIEVFIEEKRIENGNVSPWNGGNAIVGIQGDITPLGPNNQYAVAPCRNGLDTNWETTNEAWRFTPNGADITPDNVTWYSATNGGITGTSIGSGSTIIVTTPDTYFAVSDYSTCAGAVQLTDEIVVNQSSKTWMGYTNNNWYVATNWLPNGVPLATDCVLIPDISVSDSDAPIANDINQPAYALNLTLAPTARLEIASNTELVVTDYIHLDGIINIRDSGSLIQINEGLPNANNNTGNGAINMQRTATIASSYDYIYWSSPVQGFGVSNVSPGSTHIYQWIPTIAGNGAGNHGNWQATTETMLNGKGYIIRNVSGTPTPSTPEFVGMPNNGVITKAITRGTYNGGNYLGGGTTMATRLDDNWNLVGNPYPSAISANAFITTNAVVIADDVSASIAGTVYLWRHLAAPSNTINDPFYDGFVYNYNPNDYIAYNSTGSNPIGFNGDIAAGQAFFVLMEHTAPINSNILFNNTMRGETLNNGQFYRTDQPNNSTSEIEKHRIWLDLISSDNGANSILVGYIEGATNNQDRLFDGSELSETATRFYSLIGEEKMSIQGKALPFNVDDLVPLGLVIPETGNYTIAINSVDGLFESPSQDIFLEDTYNNIIHDLRNAPYGFNSASGTFNDRFILRYTNNALTLEEFEIHAGISISAPQNSYIKVTSGIENINSITIYDVLGRVLFKKQNINSNEFLISDVSDSDGVLFVKATLTNGLHKTQKVVIKQ